MSSFLRCSEERERVREKREREKHLPAKPGSAWLRFLSSNAGGRGPDGNSMSSEQEQL